jgi:hypothetical protein
MEGANVQIDEGEWRKTPYLFEKVQPGQHVVRILNFRVGDRMYTVGDPVQVEVSPGETAVVSRTFVEGKAHLAIRDAPSGSIVTIDGKSVDSEKALTTGIEVPAGWMDVVVQEPNSQKWTGTPFAAVGSFIHKSINEMTLALPLRDIKIDGSFDDWNGIPPVFTSGTRWPKERNWAIDKVYLAVDEKNLYMRFDIKDDRKSSFFHPNNFDTSHDFTDYGIDVWNGEKQIILQVFYDSQNPGWFVGISKYVDRQGILIEGVRGNYGMKGSSLEASFSLITIESYLGKLDPGDHYNVQARTVYRYSPGNYFIADSTQMKMLAF